MLSPSARCTLIALRGPFLAFAFFGASACSDDSAATPEMTNGTRATSGGSTTTSGVNGANSSGGPVSASVTSSTGVTSSTATTTGLNSTTTTAGASGPTSSVATTISSATSTTTATASTGSGGSSTTGTTIGAGGTGGGSTASVTDDFETAAAGDPPDIAVWQLRLPSNAGSSVEVTSEQAHGGTQSVKVTGASGSTMFYTENVFPLPAGVVYFRVWVRFTSADFANHNAFVVSGPGEESQEARFGGQNGAFHANLPADGDKLSPDPYESPSCMRCVAPVPEQWTCLQGKFDFANNAAELYVDDTLAVDSAADGWGASHTTGVFPMNPTQLGFGWALYGAPMNTVYFDDVAIGYEPISCD